MKHTILLLLLTVVIAALPSTPAVGQSSTPAEATRLYLPLITDSRPLGVFGVEATRVDPARGLATMVELGPTWVRRNGLRWGAIEPVEGQPFRWDHPSTQAIEADMIQASAHGMRLILIVRSSPAWAVAPSSGDCGPILPAKQAAFARFLRAVVARYSQPPYNVKYWEIGNEPDAPIISTDRAYGCWGDENDPFYGGRAYGELLKVASAAIKSADPRAQVLNGGLLLDQPFDKSTNTGRSARFLEGMLEAGAGSALDLLSYHSYSFYNSNGSPDGSLGSDDWKPAYLREILGRYGLSKPLINTEGALLCEQASSQCAQAQAYAIPRLYARAMRDDLRGFIWYIFDSDGFRNTALVEPTAPSTRRPAHRAFAQASIALAGKGFDGPIAGLPNGVEGYRFSQGGRVVLVLWSDVPQSVQLNLGPNTGLACAEWDGAALACSASAGKLTLQARPAARYISFTTP